MNDPNGDSDISDRSEGSVPPLEQTAEETITPLEWEGMSRSNVPQVLEVEQKCRESVDARNRRSGLQGPQAIQMRSDRNTRQIHFDTRRTANGMTIGDRAESGLDALEKKLGSKITTSEQIRAFTPQETAQLIEAERSIFKVHIRVPLENKAALLDSLLDWMERGAASNVRRPSEIAYFKMCPDEDLHSFVIYIDPQFGMEGVERVAGVLNGMCQKLEIPPIEDTEAESLYYLHSGAYERPIDRYIRKYQGAKWPPAYYARVGDCNSRIYVSQGNGYIKEGLRSRRDMDLIDVCDYDQNYAFYMPKTS